MTQPITLTTRLINDSDIILTCTLVSITKTFATILVDGKNKRSKIYTSFDGSKYVMPYGKYSMAQVFKLNINS